MERINLGYCEECYQKLVAENLKLQENALKSICKYGYYDEDHKKTICIDVKKFKELIHADFIEWE